MTKTRLLVLAVMLALLAAVPTSARASAPPAGNDAAAVAQAGCAWLKKKAKRYRQGSAKRRRYMRRYRKCRSRAKSPAPSQPPPAPPAAAPPAAPAPATLPVGPLYLPSVFPNPNGYVAGGGCQPGNEQTYRLAGFSCQYAGYNHPVFQPGGPVWTPVYLLFGVWYCADGQFRFRC